MQREMATLVYKKAPRSTELYPNNPATQGKNVLVNQPRAMRFKGCPWGPFADAGGKHNLRAARGSKWGRNDKDEFDVTKDLTMIPINRLPPVLQGFSRPTTHLAILEKVGAAIAVQASVRKMLRSARHQQERKARAIREAEERSTGGDGRSPHTGGRQTEIANRACTRGHWSGRKEPGGQARKDGRRRH